MSFETFSFQFTLPIFCSYFIIFIILICLFQLFYLMIYFNSFIIFRTPTPYYASTQFHIHLKLPHFLPCPSSFFHSTLSFSISSTFFCRETLESLFFVLQKNIYRLQESKIVSNIIKDQMHSQAEKYAFMVDVSGSTGGSDNYWKTVGDLLTLHAHQIGHYYEWDCEIKQVDKATMEQQIKSKSGKGGTSPEMVAKQIKEKGLTKVILITDGQVGDNSVRECDKILDGYKFTKTICYIISSSNYGVLNMSVTCPFTRRCENEVYEKYADRPLKKLVQYSPEDYKILDTLDEITLENFEANFDTIQGLIIALNMGKDGNIPLKNQLVELKKRLLKELSKKMKGQVDINAEIRAHLEKGDLEGAIKLAEKITSDYFSQSITLDLEKKINHLISLCGDLRGKYDLNQIKSNKMAHAEDAKQGQIDQNADAQEISKNLIECPIIMDQDVPQILVDECEPILVGVQKSIVDDITSCPLRLLNYPQIKAKLKARLSNYMGVKYADKFLKNPFTQGKLLGSIPLGSHPSHVKVGNYTIAKMFSDGKILGNFNMFFAAIWYIIKEKEIQYLKDIEKNVTEHLVHRLKNSKTMASLCGLSQFVNTQLSSDIAVWYCVNSGCLNQPPNRDTFRFHIYNMQVLMEITKALGYPIHKGIYNHFNRTKSLLNILSVLKRSSQSVQISFREGLRCIYQNSIQINPKNVGKQFAKNEIVVNFVPIDGQAPKEKTEKILSLLPQCLRELSLDEIIKIGAMLDTQKLASDYQIDFDFKADLLPKPEINWVYELKELKEFVGSEEKICPQTFRVYSSEKNQNWKQVAEKKYNAPVKKLLKGRKYFQAFLRKYNRVPTKDQLILFYYNKYVVAKKTRTLPYLTQTWAEKLIGQYSEVMKGHNITVQKAIKLLQDSNTLEKRKLLEKSAE